MPGNWREGRPNEFYLLAKLDQWAEKRIQVMVKLSRRGDRILETPNLDLHTLKVLAADFVAAKRPRNPACPLTGYCVCDGLSIHITRQEQLMLTIYQESPRACVCILHL